MNKFSTLYTYWGLRKSYKLLHTYGVNQETTETVISVRSFSLIKDITPWWFATSLRVNSHLLYQFGGVSYPNNKLSIFYREVETYRQWPWYKMNNLYHKLY